MQKLYLLAFLLVAASAKLAIEINNAAQSREMFNCLASKNMTRALLQFWDEKGTINKEFLGNYIRARDANITSFGAIAVLNDTFTPDQLCNGIAHALPFNFSGTIWLQVKDSRGLWSREVDSRVSYLENVAKTCQQHGLKPGFYSNAVDWSAVLGAQGAGSDILSATPVWYSNTNNVVSFDDFCYAGFGTWDEPDMKNYAGYTSFCNQYFLGADYYEN